MLSYNIYPNLCDINKFGIENFFYYNKVSVSCEKMKGILFLFNIFRGNILFFSKSTNDFNLNFHNSVIKLTNLDLNNFLKVNC